jgi:hypothetical protein
MPIINGHPHHMAEQRYLTKYVLEDLTDKMYFSAAKRSLFTLIDRERYFLKRLLGGQKVRYSGLKRLSLK